MAKQFFAPTKMTSESKALVVQMEDILRNYQRQGFDLSLRQLYYQLVSRNIVPNTEQSYKRVGSILSDARMCGYIDWDMIVDRGRETVENTHWDNPGDIVEAAARQFRYELWSDQPWHIEVMVEKQALEGILEPVCRTLDVPFTANKGYSSSSAMYEAGKRIQGKLDAGKNICVLYLGDHDPSGIDMTRDVRDRLYLFSGFHFYQAKPGIAREEARQTMDSRKFARYKDAQYKDLDFAVERIALNMDQIEEYGPPPNPAKLTDSRASSYIEMYGHESWELDALEPRVLAALVQDAVEAKRDEDLWDAAVERQDEARKKLTAVAQDMKG